MLSGGLEDYGKKTKMNVCRILPLVKKNPFTSSTEAKNTLENVDVSLLYDQSRDVSCLKIQGIDNMVKTTGNIEELEILIRLCQKTSKKHLQN